MKLGNKSLIFIVVALVFGLFIGYSASQYFAEQNNLFYTDIKDVPEDFDIGMNTGNEEMFNGIDRHKGKRLMEEIIRELQLLKNKKAYGNVQKMITVISTSNHNPWIKELIDDMGKERWEQLSKDLSNTMTVHENGVVYTGNGAMEPKEFLAKQLENAPKEVVDAIMKERYGNFEQKEKISAEEYINAVTSEEQEKAFNVVQEYYKKMKAFQWESTELSREEKRYNASWGNRYKPGTFLVYNTWITSEDLGESFERYAVVVKNEQGLWEVVEEWY